MKISSVINDNSVLFGSRRTFKRQFKTCAYSGEGFEQHDTKTLEHIIPQIKGGKNEYSNYLIVKRSVNSRRSAKPLDEFIKENPEVKQNIINTVKSKEGQIIEGINWAEEVKKTLFKAIGYDIFNE